jgi:nucleotide-binding universal stress UspA family protein
MNAQECRLRLFVTEADKAAAADGQGTILVPMSAAGDGREALELAAKLAVKSGARLVLLQVLRLNIAGEERGIARERLMEGLACETAARLLEQARDLGENAAAEVVVTSEAPARSIVESANRLDADAIVMEAHPRRRWMPWMRRNTIQTVTRNARCSVWIVSRDEDQTHEGPGLSLFDTRTWRLARRHVQFSFRPVFRALFS